MWLVAGLGNPGANYVGTRHNIGFMVEEALRGRWRADPAREKFGADLCEGRLGEERVILLKPMEFMNLSGQAVTRASQFWKIPVERIVVIHDELDVPFEQLRVARGGGPGGHNGVRSIIESLGTKDFPRLRVGVGRPPGGGDASSYVLGKFAPAERALVPALVDRAADAVTAILERGTTAAMNEFNAPPRSKEEQG